jgi:hypothetical protein
MYCCMRWPSGYSDWRGSKLTLCLTYISLEERQAVMEAVGKSGCARDNPLLMYVLQERLPVFLSREELLYLVEDLEKCDERLIGVLAGPARDGYLALSSFVRQAADQRYAEVSFEEKIPAQTEDRPASVLVVDRSERPLGIDVHSILLSVGWYDVPPDFPYDNILAWNGFLVVGADDQVHLSPLEGGDARAYELGEWFWQLYPAENSLLVASARDLLCLDASGSPRWWARHLGADGVVIERVREGTVHGLGDWDPPGGWAPFSIRLDSGERFS